MQRLEEDSTQRAAAYKASLRHMTVTVTEVEPVLHSQADMLIGSMIVTKEYLGQKILVRFSCGLKTISVEDRLELTLDGWIVVKASKVEVVGEGYPFAK